MDRLFRHVAPLAQTARDAAVVARCLRAVLDVMKGYHAPAPIGTVAATSQLDPEDTRRVLYVLEELGYVEVTHFQITERGRAAAKEQ